MTMPLQMTGHDREYRPPRALRTKAAANDQPDALTARIAAGQVSPWDLFALENDTDAGSWAQATMTSLIATIDADTDAALGCTECTDTGFYGVSEPGNTDLLTGLIKREGEGKYQSLQTSGVWQDWDPKSVPLEVLDLDLAGDLAAAITAGACGLLRRYAWPQAFLPPAAVVAATTVSSLISAENGDTPHGEWVNYAVVDEDDPGAVLDVVRVASGQAERWVDGVWTPDDDLLLDLTIPLVHLDDEVFRGLVAGSPLTAQQCKYCKNAATKSILHSEGMAYIPVCGDHLDQGKTDAAACVPSGDPDPSNIDSIRDITAAGLVADAPLTVSPDPRAERLRRYWSSGRGAAKIRWGMPGDWRRCYRQLRKYMGLRAKGWCQNMHKRNNGFWTGSRLNASGSLNQDPVRDSAGHVLSVGDCFEVKGLETGSYTAQVINFPILRDRAAPNFKGESVDVALTASGVTKNSVAILLRSTGPEPMGPKVPRPVIAYGAEIQQPLLNRAAVSPQDSSLTFSTILTPTIKEVLRAKPALPNVLLAAVSAALGDDARSAHRTASSGVAILLPASIVSLAEPPSDNRAARTLVDHTGKHGFHNTLKASVEESLLAAVRSGQWTTKEEGIDMDTDTLLHDGIYYEIDTTDEGLLRTVTAGGFPVQPPAEWFENPKLGGPTPLTITDEGRVFGHIATRDVAHIGYQGQRVIAPRSASGYAYFCTGEMVASGGKKFNVGQLTLAGGHAPLQATAEQAVKHYDDTNSGIADVAAGDDQYGVWVAGSLRPTVTPEQVRVIRASSPSGDWRPIGGNLEMVAVCHVNVPGFPTARVLRAGGAIQALVAAGARPLAVLRASLTAESSVLERLATLEAKIAAAPEMATIEDAVVEPAAEAELPETPAPETTEPAAVQEVPDTPEAVETTEPTPDAEAASQAEALRAEIQEIKAQALRDEVSSMTAAIKTQERKGGGFPIKDEASLKDAISAFGRAKPEDREKTKAHIISAAKKLGKESLVPIKWRTGASK